MDNRRYKYEWSALDWLLRSDLPTREREAQMDKYTATFGKGRSRILSVHAESVQEADTEIERQLYRPGRRALLGQWQAGGRRMMVNDDSEYVVSIFDTKEYRHHLRQGSLADEPIAPGAAGSWKRSVQDEEARIRRGYYVDVVWEETDV